MSNKSIKEIVTEWLLANGYDGLCNPDAECGCLIADDLIPCDCPNNNYCVAGYKCSDDKYDNDYCGWRVCTERDGEEE